MSHAELVQRAAMWLANSKRCNPVLTEVVCASGGNSEVPDIIGWASYSSYVVECKASINDFYADRSKSFRRLPDRGMGEVRFFFCEKDVIPAAAVEKLNGERGGPAWGLAYVCGQVVRVVVEPRRFPKAHAAMAERPLLRAVIRFPRGIYQAETPEVQP